MHSVCMAYILHIGDRGVGRGRLFVFNKEGKGIFSMSSRDDMDIIAVKEEPAYILYEFFGDKIYYLLTKTKKIGNEYESGTEILGFHMCGASDEDVKKNTEFAEMIYNADIPQILKKFLYIHL